MHSGFRLRRFILLHSSELISISNFLRILFELFRSQREQLFNFNWSNAMQKSGFLVQQILIVIVSLVANLGNFPWRGYFPFAAIFQWKPNVSLDSIRCSIPTTFPNLVRIIQTPPELHDSTCRCVIQDKSSVMPRRSERLSPSDSVTRLNQHQIAVTHDTDACVFVAMTNGLVAELTRFALSWGVSLRD